MYQVACNFNYLNVLKCYLYHCSHRVKLVIICVHKILFFEYFLKITVIVHDHFLLLRKKRRKEHFSYDSPRTVFPSCTFRIFFICHLLKKLHTPLQVEPSITSEPQKNLQWRTNRPPNKLTNLSWKSFFFEWYL